MKMVGKTALVTALMLSPLCINVVWADEAALNQRIDRLERIIKGQGLVSLLSRVDQLQNEIQRLNGENEALHHKLEVMQKRQRDLYLDLDERLLQSQSQAIAVTPSTVAGTNEEGVIDPIISQATLPVETTEPAAEIQAPVASEADTEVNIAPAVDTQVNATPVAVENGEAAYQAALQTLRGGQYEQAITALSAFPEQYPQSNYLPNAYYWQGEANYVLRHFDMAVTAFQTVIDRFPASTKVADATLKLGFSQYELGTIDTATTTLNKVVEQYPNTSAARLAKVRLDRINKANR
jgi:tol-pal system protein YbgF